MLAEEIQYVTRQELLTVAAIIVSLSALISGIIMAILKGTINMKILSLIQNLDDKTERKQEKLDNEMSEIRDNYLSRFERQYQMLSDLRESVIEIKAEIKKDLEYIKSKL